MNFNKAAYLASYGTGGQLPESEKPEVVFAGRSNVGKSSLINRLVYRKQLARVSAEPGKTATINFYGVDDAIFVDLPGYGYAKVSKREKARWSELIERYFAQTRDLRLVVSLMDMRHPPSALDLDMVNFLIDRELPFVVALTKADKLTARQQAAQLNAIRQALPCGEQLTLLPVSAENGDGMDALREILDEVTR